MRSGIEFTIGVSAGPAFAVAVIGVGVDDPVLLDGFEVAPTSPDILAPVKDDGLKACFEQFEGSEIAAWSGAYNQYVFIGLKGFEAFQDSRFGLEGLMEV